MTRICSLLALLALLSLATPAGASTKIDYGPISHKGLKKLGGISSSKKLTLQLGLIANQSGLQKAVKAASNPASSSYGKYPSLSTLQSKYGASSSKRKGVVNAFKKQSVKATIDVTHLRATATVSIGKAKKLFGTKWAVYKAKSGAHVALPVNTPKAPSGIKGNVDTIAGTRLQLTSGSSSAFARRARRRAPGRRTWAARRAPTRARAASASGLFPNQILTAYGIAPLQAAGVQGQGARLAIVGEAPTPASDVNAFRSCFGTQGTSLKIHNAGSIKPILESSLDAMVASMVAPKLANFDLWVHPLSESDDDGDAEGFLVLLAQPLQATTNGAKLPNVISVSYGTCESNVSPYTAARTLVERQLTATAALGITTVVAAGDTGSSACARGVKPSQLTSSDKKPQVSWPASSPWVLAVGGTNLTLDAGNGIASTGPWNDTVYPVPFNKAARRWRRAEHVRIAPVVAAGAVVRELEVPHGARPGRVRRREPGLPDRLLERGAELPRRAAEHHVRRRHQRLDPARRRDGRPVGPAGAQPGAAEARLRPAAALHAGAAQPGHVRGRHDRAATRSSAARAARRGPASTSQRAGDRRWRTRLPAGSSGSGDARRGPVADPRSSIPNARRIARVHPTPARGPARTDQRSPRPPRSSSSRRSPTRYGNRFLLEPAPDNAAARARHARRSTRCG